MYTTITIKDFPEVYFFAEVYDLLIEKGGACETMKEDFIRAHLSDNTYICEEWRFSGKFGFGGKYRRKRNTIDFYRENETEELNILRDTINDKLKEIYATHKSKGLILEVE